MAGRMLMLADGLETLGASVITGDGGDNQLFGTDGADKISGLGGDDTLEGGDGKDTLLGGSGDDDLSGGAGFDRLYGGGGNDYLNAGGGSDGEILSGDAGDDIMVGGGGDDLFDGGDGVDQAWFAGSTAVHVDLRVQGEAQDTGRGMDTLVGVEGVRGSSLGDRLTGDDNANLLDGNGGGDVLTGGGGDDLMIVGGGTSKISGGSGSDTLEVYVTAGFDVDLSLRAQDFEFGSLKLKGVESLSASLFSLGEDTLVGSSHDNTLAGSSGSDVLQGGGGNDLLLGQGYASAAGEFDWWGGEAGIDTMDGGAGSDILAGSGDLTGGKGADTFVFFVPTDLGFTQELGTIHDLTRKDMVDLSAIDADAGSDGDQAFHLVSHFTGAAGELVRSYDAGSDTTTFMMDVSGAGSADIELHADGNVAGFDNFVL